jgi:beta-glucosidase
MSSYNKLNGTFTSENPWLLDQVLRREWHYDGVVMSDWFGSHSTAPTVNAGLDLEMPGPARDRGEKLVAAVEAGEVSRDTLRARVLDVLRLMQRTGALDDHRAWEERADDRAEHRALIRRAGAEGAVLLKNEGELLPLSGAGRIAVIGPNAKVAQIMGAAARSSTRIIGCRHGTGWLRRWARIASPMRRGRPTTASSRCCAAGSRPSISPMRR